MQGFTLIEIMVVIVILGILAALVVPRVVGRADDARVTAAKQDVAQIMQALNLYRLDNGRYPTQEQGLQALVSKPTMAPVPNSWRRGGYLSKMPNDPWKNPYQYANPGLRNDVEVYSLGADGKSGGIEFDADIGSWDL
jgi:general secretion pathway protein G